MRGKNLCKHFRDANLQGGVERENTRIAFPLAMTLLEAAGCTICTIGAENDVMFMSQRPNPSDMKISLISKLTLLPLKKHSSVPLLIQLHINIFHHRSVLATHSSSMTVSVCKGDVASFKSQHPHNCLPERQWILLFCCCHQSSEQLLNPYSSKCRLPTQLLVLQYQQ